MQVAFRFNSGGTYKGTKGGTHMSYTVVLFNKLGSINMNTMVFIEL